MRNKRLCIKALVPGAAASTDIARNTPSIRPTHRSVTTARMPALQKMDLSAQITGERTLWTGAHQSAEPATGAVIEKAGDQWLSFNVREEFLHGLAVGSRRKSCTPAQRKPRRRL
jgi:hypothetical protein